MTNALLMKYSQVWERPSELRKQNRGGIASEVGWELSQLDCMIRFTSKELKVIGVNPESNHVTVKRIRAIWEKEYPEIAHPFPDAPSQHWTTGAIANLRKSGVLTGYPSGRFHTP